MGLGALSTSLITAHSFTVFPKEIQGQGWGQKFQGLDGSSSLIPRPLQSLLPMVGLVSYG